MGNILKKLLLALPPALLISPLTAGMRMVVGFDPQPSAHLVSITGQNEFFMSRHYDDMTGLWLSGKYFPVEEAEVRYETVMQPG